MDLYSISELASVQQLNPDDLLLVSQKQGSSYVSRSATAEAVSQTVGGSGGLPVMDEQSNPAVYTVNTYYFAMDFWPDYKVQPPDGIDRYPARPLLSSWVSYDASTKTYTFDPKKNGVFIPVNKVDSLSVLDSSGRCVHIQGMEGRRVIIEAGQKFKIQDENSAFNTPGWNPMTGLRHNSITGYVRKSQHSASFVFYPTLPHVQGEHDNFKKFKITSPLDFLRGDLEDLNGSGKKFSDYFDFVDGAWMDSKVIEDKQCKKIYSISSGDVDKRLDIAMLSCMPLDGTSPSFDKEFYHHFSSKADFKNALDGIGSSEVAGMGARLRPKTDKIADHSLYVKTTRNCWAVLAGPGQYTVRNSSGSTSKHAGMFSTVQVFQGGDSSKTQQLEAVCTGRFEEVQTWQGLNPTIAFKWMAAEISKQNTASAVMPGVCTTEPGSSFFQKCFPEIEVILVEK